MKPLNLSAVAFYVAHTVLLLLGSGAGAGTPIGIGAITEPGLADLEDKVITHFAEAAFTDEADASLELIARLASRYGAEDSRVKRQQALHRSLVRTLILPHDDRTTLAETRKLFAKADELFFVKRSRDCIGLYREAWRQQASVLGQEDPVAIDMRWRLGLAIKAYGKGEEALVELKAVLPLVSREFGPAYESSLMNSIQLVYRDLGKYGSAIEAGRKAHALSVSSWGEAAPQNASILLNLATTYNHTEAFAEAETAAKKAAEVFGTRGEAYAGFSAAARFEQARSLTGLGQQEHAAAAYEEALAIAESLPAEDQAQLSHTLSREYSRYADLLRQMGREQAAKDIEARSAELPRRDIVPTKR